MKAAVYRTCGPPGVVRVEDVPTPRPKDHEVLIRIRAATVSSADWRVRSADRVIDYTREDFRRGPTAAPTVSTMTSQAGGAGHDGVTTLSAARAW